MGCPMSSQYEPSYGGGVNNEGNARVPDATLIRLSSRSAGWHYSKPPDGRRLSLRALPLSTRIIVSPLPLHQRHTLICHFTTGNQNRLNTCKCFNWHALNISPESLRMYETVHAPGVWYAIFPSPHRRC